MKRVGVAIINTDKESLLAYKKSREIENRFKKIEDTLARLERRIQEGTIKNGEY